MSHLSVENYFLDKATIPFLDKKIEKIPVVTVNNYGVLGQITALRFIEWVVENPDGVVALGAGKSPVYFIAWLKYYRDNWSEELEKEVLVETGLSEKCFPVFSGLHLVQIGEIFPISPKNKYSYNYFVKKYYIGEFGFDDEKSLLFNTNVATVFSDNKKNEYATIKEIFSTGRIDLGLRYSLPIDELGVLQKKVIKYFDQECENYEKTIRKMGGIGFFLDTIGADGNIAFNACGTSHLSNTRLTNMNYEAMASAASDMGGIEEVRKKAIVTIGIDTITYNRNCLAIIYAAGEENTELIAHAIEHSPTIENPASALQKLPNARFYLTPGSASMLSRRRLDALLIKKKISKNEIDRLIIDSSFSLKMKLKEYGADGKKEIPSDFSNVVKQLTGKTTVVLAKKTKSHIVEKINRGLDLPNNQVFLHTAPHHDDIELAYFPLLHHLVRSPSNKNHFSYMTSGFTAVTNTYVEDAMAFILKAICNGELFKTVERKMIFSPNHTEIEIHGYLNAIALQNGENAKLYFAIRQVRNISVYLNTDSDSIIMAYCQEQLEILKNHTPGNMVKDSIKQIKSWIREWEAELVWAHFGLRVRDIYHMRLKFDSMNLFAKDLDMNVEAIVRLFEKIKPTIVTLAMDPEGSGPDTHYKTLHAIRIALEIYSKNNSVQDMRIWGYRNVWSRFHISDATMIVPVSLNSFAVLQNMFNTCFISQKSASFPSKKYDGTFSELAQKIWVEQFGDLTRLLGKSFFYNDSHPMKQRAYGAIYLCDMSVVEFLGNEQLIPNGKFEEVSPAGN